MNGMRLWVSGKIYNIDLDAGTYYLKVTGYERGESYPSTGTYKFTIGEPTPDPIAVTGVQLDQSSMTLEVGEEADLYAEVLPDNAEILL